jgi:hypothetical protein
MQPLVRTLLRKDDVRYDAYLEDGECLIRVLAVDGPIVWYEDCLEDAETDAPRQTHLTTICRNFRLVRHGDP